jgi:hypothetical protein
VEPARLALRLIRGPGTAALKGPAAGADSGRGGDDDLQCPGHVLKMNGRCTAMAKKKDKKDKDKKKKGGKKK